MHKIIQNYSMQVENNSKYLYKAYFVPRTVLNDLQLLSHLILTTALGYRCYYAHFTNKETEKTESE